jgi:poly(3-hydroxybutyrate) depolymerase
VKNRNVDPRRIYTAGCSAGGLMATAMAAQRSTYIAAAAPNSGGFTFPQQFNSMHTPPLMTIHGAPGQDVVGVDFSMSSATADMAFKQRGGLAIDCNTGGGHCGGGGLAGDAWKFFQAHPYGVDPEPYKAMLPAGFSPQCKLQ